MDTLLLFGILSCMSFRSLTYCMGTPLKYGYVSNENVLKQKAGVSFQKCYEECQKYPRLCTGIAYNRYMHLCILYHVSEQPASLSKHLHFIYSNASIWTKPPQQTCGDDCALGEACTSSNTNEPTCVRELCNDVPALDVYYATRIVGNMNNIESKRLFMCDGAPEQQTMGPMIIECLSNGTWVLESQPVACLPFGRIQHGVYFDPGTFKVLEPVYNINRSECVVLCHEDTSFCMGINYHAENRTCEMVSQIQHVVIRPGWEIVHKEFPIFQAFSSSGGRYTMTLSEGIARCEELGTQIATHAQVLLAYSMGFTECSCGFVNDMVKPIISMNYPIEPCFTYIGVRECHWQSTISNVYCINTKFRFS